MGSHRRASSTWKARALRSAPHTNPKRKRGLAGTLCRQWHALRCPYFGQTAHQGFNLIAGLCKIAGQPRISLDNSRWRPNNATIPQFERPANDGPFPASREKSGQGSYGQGMDLPVRGDRGGDLRRSTRFCRGIRAAGNALCCVPCAGLGGKIWGWHGRPGVFRYRPGGEKRRRLNELHDERRSRRRQCICHLPG